MESHAIENGENERIADRFTPDGTKLVVKEGDAYVAYFPYNWKVGGTRTELDPDKVEPIVPVAKCPSLL